MPAGDVLSTSYVTFDWYRNRIFVYIFGSKMYDSKCSAFNFVHDSALGKDLDPYLFYSSLNASEGEFFNP